MSILHNTYIYIEIYGNLSVPLDQLQLAVTLLMQHEAPSARQRNCVMWNVQKCKSL